MPLFYKIVIIYKNAYKTKWLMIV